MKGGEKVADVQHNFTIGEYSLYLDVITGELVEGVIEHIREDRDLVYLMLRLSDKTLKTVTSRVKVRD